MVPEVIIENLRFYGSLLDSLIAYTVMPEHVHLMVEVGLVSTLSAFLRDFKKRTSVEIRRKTECDERFIWLRGSRDHCIRGSRSGRDFKTHLRYIFLNSWKHLHIPPHAYPYHNLSEAIERGIVDAACFSSGFDG
jgi:REP element-mobilizing transposase RayT